MLGYTGDEITYNFVAEGAETIESIASIGAIRLPVPSKEGYVNLGWYDNAEFSGNAVSEYYYSTEKTTLYAKLVTEEEYINDYLLGKSMEYAYAIESAATFDVKIKTGGEKIYYVVTVSAGEVWNVTTVGTGDHNLWFYDEDGNEIHAYDKGYAENYNYTFDTAGTYYIGIGYRGSKAVGEFEVTFTEK